MKQKKSQGIWKIIPTTVTTKQNSLTKRNNPRRVSVSMKFCTSKY